MLDTNMKTQLKAYLEKLTKPVELIATLDDSAKSAEIKELLDDLGANVTPAIYYMSKENTLQQAVGLPDQKTLNIIMGNK